MNFSHYAEKDVADGFGYPLKRLIIMRIPPPRFLLRCFLRQGFHFIAISLHRHGAQLIEEFDQRVRVLRSKVGDDRVDPHGHCGARFGLVDAFACNAGIAHCPIAWSVARWLIGWGSRFA